jgi:hypothetical protein
MAQTTESERCGHARGSTCRSESIRRRPSRPVFVVSCRFGGIIAAGDREPLGAALPEKDSTMSRLQPRAHAVAVFVVISLTLMAVTTARGQGAAPAPLCGDVGEPGRGPCVHREGMRPVPRDPRGGSHRGAGACPDRAKSFFDIGAVMSNHLRGVLIPKPTLSADEVTSLIAFLFTLQYYDQPGDPKAGEQAFAAKSCIQCHEVVARVVGAGPVSTSSSAPTLRCS